MNDQRVKTDNEAAIAEFMGWERYSQNSFKCPNTYPINNNTSNGWTTFSADQLEFGSRWDWLMPVVEKIESLTVSDTDEEGREIEWQFSFQIHGFQAMVHRDVLPQYHGTDEDFLKLYDCHNESKIAAVYKAVVEFIHWYQKQKSS